MTITITQEVYEIRSISSVHINPSIMEGEQQLASIIGSQRGDSIERYAPVFIIAPVIEGDPGIPSILFCTPGVVDASPSAYRSYQWYIDGVPGQNGIGDTFAYLTTNDFMDSKNLTCRVSAINVVGSVSALSNSVFVSLVESVNVNENYIYGITGIPALDHITVLMDEIAVLTGMWVDEHITTFGEHVFALTGIDLLDHVSIYQFDTYSSEFLSVISTVNILNRSAETGIGSWTSVGGLQSVTTVPSPGLAGTKAFRGPHISATVCNFDQVVTIDPSMSDKIDSGNCYMSMGYYATRVNQPGFAGSVRGYYVLLDASDTVLGTYDYFGVNTPATNVHDDVTNHWNYLSSPPITVPVNTRKARVYLEFPAHFGINQGNICLIDEISLKLLQVIT